MLRIMHLISIVIKSLQAGMYGAKSMQSRIVETGVLQVFGTGSGFLRHHPPQNVEPQTNGFACPLKDCSSSNRGFWPAFRAGQKGTLGHPRPIAMATGTCKSCYELFKVFWTILWLHNLLSMTIEWKLYYILWLLEASGYPVLQIRRLSRSSGLIKYSFI